MSQKDASVAVARERVSLRGGRELVALSTLADVEIVAKLGEGIVVAAGASHVWERIESGVDRVLGPWTLYGGMKSWAGSDVAADGVALLELGCCRGSSAAAWVVLGSRILWQATDLSCVQKTATERALFAVDPDAASFTDTGDFTRRALEYIGSLSRMPHWSAYSMRGTGYWLRHSEHLGTLVDKQRDAAHWLETVSRQYVEFYMDHRVGSQSLYLLPDSS